MASHAVKIREVRTEDYAVLYRLYVEQVAHVPRQQKVLRRQFDEDLFTCRMSRDPAAHHPRARIGLVAERKGRVVAFVSGGMVVRGDEVLHEKTGYIQAVIAEPGARTEVVALVQRVVAHVKRYRPREVVAFEGCLSPVFTGDAACCLPSACAWIGQCLLAAGFEVNQTMQRMACDLPGRRAPRRPRGMKFHHCHHEMCGFPEKYDFGCVLLKPPYQQENAVAWCGNFYAGAFIKGAGYRTLYVNWLTIIGEHNLRRGYGRVILQHVLHEAVLQGAKRAVLITNTDNFIAGHLYRSEGFAVVDVVQSFVFKPGRQRV